MPWSCEDERGIPGLNQSQLAQLKHLVESAEERRNDEAAAACLDEFRKSGAGHGEDAAHSPCPPTANGKITTTAGHEDIDAFFSRFSIQNDGEGLHECPREAGHGTEKETLMSGVGVDGKRTNSHCTKPPHEPATAPSVKDHRRTVFEKSEAPSVSVKVAELRSKLKHPPREKNANLPEYVGLWKSPWLNRGGGHAAATGTAVGATISRRDSCQQAHAGYSNVDFYSLYEATVVQAKDEDIDQAPWEYRDVGQRFLHEKSLESRNWFGSFKIQRGNDRVPNPVCRVKSLEVAVTKIPAQGEWNEDWYTTWQSRKENPNNLVAFSQGEDAVPPVEYLYIGDSANLRHENGALAAKKIIVEIGSLNPVRARGGERVSRIHPEFTSSLRHSRWRKKYLKGLFPTD